MAMGTLRCGYDLRVLRESLGLTQSEFSHYMGLSLRAYQEAEGSSELRLLHSLAAERVAIESMIEHADPRIAPPGFDTGAFIDACSGTTRDQDDEFTFYGAIAFEAVKELLISLEHKNVLSPNEVKAIKGEVHRGLGAHKDDRARKATRFLQELPG
jgi:transcriptional regulator with XRE-family HTH domain